MRASQNLLLSPHRRHTELCCALYSLTVGSRVGGDVGPHGHLLGGGLLHHGVFLRARAGRAEEGDQDEGEQQQTESDRSRSTAPCVATRIHWMRPPHACDAIRAIRQTYELEVRTSVLYRRPQRCLSCRDSHRTRHPNAITSQHSSQTPSSTYSHPRLRSFIHPPSTTEHPAPREHRSGGSGGAAARVLGRWRWHGHGGWRGRWISIIAAAATTAALSANAAGACGGERAASPGGREEESGSERGHGQGRRAGSFQLRLVAATFRRRSPPGCRFCRFSFW
jgi:hypothetical protein